MRISLQTKIFLLLGILLAVSLSVIGFLNLQYLRTETTRNIFELHRAQLEKVRTQIESLLTSVDEKSESMARWDSRGEMELAKEVLRRDSKILLAGVWSLETQSLKLMYKNQKESLTPQKIEETLRKNISHTLERSQLVSLKEIGPGILAYLRPLRGERSERSELRQALVTILDFSELQNAMSTGGPGEMLLLTSGQELILGSPETKKWSALFEKARSFPANNSTLEYSSDSEKYLGSFEKIGKDWVLLSVSNEKTAFAGLESLSEKILILTLMTLTFAFMVSVKFSHSLSRPLLVLVERMKTVGEGDLQSPVVVESRDEIFDLSLSFQKMISELKASRDQLQETNRNLEARVLERTVELEKQNRIVQETQEAMLRTTRLASAGEVAGRAAHEVLNPLTSLMARLDVFEGRVSKESAEIKNFLTEISGAWAQDYRQGGFAKLVEQWKSSSKILPGKNLFEEDLENLFQIEKSIQIVATRGIDDMQFMRGEAQRIHKIVNGLRKLNQPQSDRRVHSLHVIVRDAQRIMQDLFEKRGLKIEMELTATQEQICIDKDELLQAMTNLMRNSLHSMGEKLSLSSSTSPLVLRLKTFNQISEVFLEIQDQGKGIAMEHQAKLFERQFSTKGAEEGTGLGLSISRRLMRSNQADIEFISSSSNGTVFRFRFPLDSSQKGVAA